MTRMTIAASALTIVVGGLAGLVLIASNQPFFLVGGSDSAATILAPPLAWQIVALGLLIVSLGLYAVRPKRGLAIGRWLLLVVAMGVYVMAGHRFLIDGARGEIRDVWLLVDAQALSYDEADGLSGGSRRETAIWLELADDQDIRMRVFAGIGPWRLNTEALDSHWPISAD